MTTQEIHICDFPFGRGRRLYYYQGNFFHPIDLIGAEVGIVKGAIRRFLKDNASMVAADRADPAYKTLMELCDESQAEVEG